MQIKMYWDVTSGCHDVKVIGLTPYHDLISDDSEAEDVSLLSASGRREVLTQNLWGGPQLS